MRKVDVEQCKISMQVHKAQSMKVMYGLLFYDYGNSGLLMRMPKSHDLGHVRGHVIRMSNLPKIAKIDGVRPAVPH
jgi:hypothetical protein